MAITVRPDRVILTGVSYIEASFEASWMDISVFAETSFPDVLSVDIITPTDLLAKSTSKPLYDTATVALDNLTQQFTKHCTDLLSLIDGPEFTYDYGARESETQTVVDKLKYAVSHLMSPETMHLIDNMDGDIQYAIVKVVGELQLLNEKAITSFGKNSSDVVTASDLIYAYLVVIREFAESLSVADSRFFGLLKPLSDSVVSSEVRAYSLEKPAADIANTIEAKALLFDKLIMGVESDYTLPYPEPAYFAERYAGGQTGDILFATDTFISERIYGRFPVDAVNLGESGLVTMQNYAALGYFAEDYVGEGRTI